MVFTTLIFFASLFVSAFGAPRPGKDESELPLVQSGRLSKAILSRNLATHADAFENLSRSGYRTYGSKTHNDTMDYIQKKLDATGRYTTELQSFRGFYSAGTANFAASISGVEHKYEANFFQYSPGGNVNGPLVVAKGFGCEEDDFSAAKMKDSIVLIGSWNCAPTQVKIGWALKAGAVGAIVYNETRHVKWPTLWDPERHYVPCAYISGDGIKKLVDIAQQKRVDGTLVVDAVNEVRYSNNLLACTNDGDPENIVMAGAASDSIPTSPGFNDNGSGTMALLEIALQLSKYRVKNMVCFAWWTMEQLDEFGSYTYVSSLPETELSKIAVYLNVRTIASPNYGYFTFGDCAPGSANMQKLFEGYYSKAVGVKTERGDFGFGGAFQERGICSGGVFSGACKIKSAEQAALWGGRADSDFDPNCQLPGDDKANLNEEAWVRHAQAVAYVIAIYANDVSDVPRNVTSLPQKRELGSNSRGGKRGSTAV